MKQKQHWFLRLSKILLGVVTTTIDAHFLRLGIIADDKVQIILAAIAIVCMSAWTALLLQQEVEYREEDKNDRPKIV